MLVREQKLLSEVLTELRRLLLFDLLGFDTDNDSVFLDEMVRDYWQEVGIAFTRCRPYRKNDQAFAGWRGLKPPQPWRSSMRRWGCSWTSSSPGRKGAGTAPACASVIIARRRPANDCWRIRGRRNRFAPHSRKHMRGCTLSGC
ncbi:hypothetical protein X765_29080 [Mesorhizobium sp. LSHC440B00]|uniref:hypothetical protein n=1 Tax=unclassified Mesorhizobium TaxID=325217 RepID=UPI0003CEA432|nr:MULTISPECIES: hypothetical protein [unclassified Mesorhizobium]ESX23409.1 hypothetical protein X765_29080 [Mesorhizobium sp. LSHC440B00]ESX31300.1 hypothetical protein X764_30365 [Mesorhizobium sp. LSHC440A00]